MFIPLNAINTNTYLAIGNSKLYFWVQLIKKIIGIGLLVVGVQFGVAGVTWSLAISGFIWWVIAAVANSQVLNYGFITQLKDVSTYLLLSITIGIAVFYISTLLSLPSLIAIFAYSVLFMGLYIGLSMVFNIEPYNVYIGILKNYIKKR